MAEPVRRTLAATTLVLAAAVAAFVLETDGLRAFTSETARRLAVERSPVPLPPVRLRDSRGEAIRLAELGRPALIEFVYTRCPTLCVALGQSFARIQDELVRAGAEPRPQLVSVSFDPVRDDAAALAAYGEAHGADPRRWRIVLPETEAGLRSLLEAAGVVVLPDGEGGFVHNAALHLVDREGRLAAVLAPEEIDRAVAALAQ